MTKKLIFYVMFLFFPILIAAVGSSGLSFGSNIVIDRYDADITLDQNGDMSIVETWDMDYPSAEYWVRFRDFGYGKYADGYPLYMDFSNVATFDESSASVRVFKDGVDITDDVRVGFSWDYDVDEQGFFVECYPSRSYCESIFTEMDDHALSEGKVTFVYEYKIIGAITEYTDISELNWRLFEYAEGKIKEASVTVHLPANAHAIDDIYVWGHSGAAGSIDIVSAQQIDMSLSNIGTKDYIEFRILAPRDLFPNVDLINKVYSAEMNLASLIAYEAELAEYNNLRITIAQILLYVAIASVVAMGFVTVYVYRKYDKEYEPRFQAEFYRDLPGEESPAEVSYLYYMRKINDEDVTATLLDLIRRKFVTIDYTGQDMIDADADFRLIRVDAADRSTLRPHEQQIMHWFFDVIGAGSSVSTKQIENYGKQIRNAERFQSEAKQFVRLAKQAGAEHDYFEKSLAANKTKAYSFALIPGSVLAASLLTGAFLSMDNTLAAIVTGIVTIGYLAYVATIQKRSVNGNESFVKWRAFRNFLVGFGNMKDYPMPGVTVWEHYLVYATSLKCADKVMDQLRIKLPLDDAAVSQSTFMGVGYRTRGFYYGYALGRFQRSITTARTNVTQTIVAYNAQKAGGSGHGGGFGGGSSFGGGGGGGRSR
ncbi:MAG TPA: hypothetical protein DCR44_00775 [Acholeplasmatales bacterium]|nr:MAG: hypothetical protein A2Y16_06930 [Tenericutes bacterium GWF2_57_13]HAQ55933.1 hypothetical protein [Acholeplasmatales bacterium]